MGIRTMNPKTPQLRFPMTMRAKAEILMMTMTTRMTTMIMETMMITTVTMTTVTTDNGDAATPVIAVPNLQFGTRASA